MEAALMLPNKWPPFPLVLGIRIWRPPGETQVLSLDGTLGYVRAVYVPSILTLPSTLRTKYTIVTMNNRSLQAVTHMVKQDKWLGIGDCQSGPEGNSKGHACQGGILGIQTPCSSVQCPQRERCITVTWAH